MIDRGDHQQHQRDDDGRHQHRDGTPRMEVAQRHEAENRDHREDRDLVREHRQRHDHRRGNPCCSAPPEQPQRREQHQVEELVEVADLVEEEATGRQQEERDDEEALADETRSERDDDQHDEERAQDRERDRCVEPVVVVKSLGEWAQQRADQKSPMEPVGERSRVEGGRPQIGEPEARIRRQQHRQAEQRRPERRAQREGNRRRRRLLGRDRHGTMAIACLSRGSRTLGSLEIEALPIGDVHAVCLPPGWRVAS